MKRWIFLTIWKGLGKENNHITWERMLAWLERRQQSPLQTLLLLFVALRGLNSASGMGSMEMWVPHLLCLAFARLECFIEAWEGANTVEGNRTIIEGKVCSSRGGASRGWRKSLILKYPQNRCVGHKIAELCQLEQHHTIQLIRVFTFSGLCLVPSLNTL